MKVIFATPCYQFKIDVRTAHAIRDAGKILAEAGFSVEEVQAVGSDITIVRNVLLDKCRENTADAILWVDNDVFFDPELPLALIQSDHHYIGARVPIWKNGSTCWAHGALHGDGRYRTTKTLGLGCVLMRSSVWTSIRDCDFYSHRGCGEDQSVLREWLKIGGRVWVDTLSICEHAGVPKPDCGNLYIDGKKAS